MYKNNINRILQCMLEETSILQVQVHIITNYIGTHTYVLKLMVRE